MDRSEFLIISWKKAIKPLLVALAIYFCIKLANTIFNPNGIGKFSVILIALYVTLELIGLFISYTIKSIPKTTIKSITKFNQILNYVAIILLPFIIYYSWRFDYIGTILILSVILVTRFFDLRTLKQNT